MTTEDKLARLKNRHTRYEIVLTNGTDAKYLVLYTAQHSQRGLHGRLRASGSGAEELNQARGRAPAIRRDPCHHRRGVALRCEAERHIHW